jgi:fido (protein-threonine AMPylation protein)
LERKDLWTLVMDQQVKSGPFLLNSHPFSYAEPCYVESLMKGMAEVVQDAHKPIDAMGLKALHRTALQHRSNAEGLAGQFRDGVAVEFAPACGDWASDEHVRALREAHGGGNPFYELEDTEGRGTVVHAKARPRAEIEAHVEDVLREHHQAMRSCVGAEAKIERIAHTCHELALTHPFSDGNGRVIGGLLVNRLLLEAGLPPYRPLSVGLVDLPVTDFAAHIGSACMAASAHPEPQEPLRVHYQDFLSDSKPRGTASPTQGHVAQVRAPAPS